MKSLSVSPPGHLSETSKRLWCELAGSRVHSTQCLTLLEQALSVLDRLHQIRTLLSNDKLISITKKTGAAHVNPLLTVEVQLRNQFTDLWWKLGLQNAPHEIR